MLLGLDPHFNTDPDQNRVQTNYCGSMRICIQIHNTEKNIPMKVHKQFKTRFIVFIVQFPCTWSGSGSAFPKRIRIQIKKQSKYLGI